MNSAIAPRHHTEGLIYLLVALTACVITVGCFGDMWREVHELSGACYTDAPSNAYPIEGSLLAARGTFFPAGRLCAHSTTEGTTVVTQTGWGLSIASALLTILSIAATAITMRDRKQFSRPIRVLVPVFTAGAVAVWALIALYVAD